MEVGDWGGGCITFGGGGIVDLLWRKEHYIRGIYFAS